MKRFLLLVILILVTATPSIAIAGDDLLERIESLEYRVSMLESLLQEPDASWDFSGSGSGNTAPFTITESPWLVKWLTESTMEARPPFAIQVHTTNTSTYMGGCGGVISENATIGQSYMYIEPGSYYLHVDSDYWVKWSISVY